MEQLITLTILITFTFTFFIIKTIRNDRREYKSYTLDKHTCLLSEIDENTIVNGSRVALFFFELLLDF